MAADAPGHPDMSLWQDRAKEWYPDLLKKTYSLPAVFMNRTKHVELKLGQQTVFVTSQQIKSIVRDDTANNLVLDCLKKLSRRNVMCVISQLDFNCYLRDLNFLSLLPRSSDPFLRSQNKDQGDFDILILHRDYGILACEIKAVGGGFSDNASKKLLAKRISAAIEQLNKSREVLKHLVSKDPIKPAIRTALMLPNIKASKLRSFLCSKKQEKLKMDLCHCLCVPDGVDPVPLCLTSDDLPNPKDWWGHVMTKEGNGQMTDEVYSTLVSRFAGPATTIKVHCSSVPRLAKAHCPDVRTLGEAVVETANRFVPVEIVLHPQQLEIFQTSSDLVHIAGPPGTGKSLLLLLKGLDWLGQDEPVHVVSANKKCLAATHMIKYQLELKMGPNYRHLIHVHDLDLTNEPVEGAEAMTKLAKDGNLFLLMDEIVADTDSEHYYSTSFSKFFKKLSDGVGTLHLWSASLFHGVELPDSLQKVTLTNPLRTPRSVTEEIQQCDSMDEGTAVLRYQTPPFPLPCDGPKILYGKHSGTKSVEDCSQCGLNVGYLLRDNLNVGGKRRSEKSPEPLRYRDIFVLISGSKCLYEKEKEKGLLTGLTDAGIPVTVLKSGDSKCVCEVACMTGPDHVVAAHCDDVKGLERKVVVFVMPSNETIDAEDDGRLHAVSRCVSQLIWVKPTSKSQSTCTISEFSNDSEEYNAVETKGSGKRKRKRKRRPENKERRKALKK